MKKSPWTTAERTTVENGITTIRPLRNGKPGGTEAEIARAMAEVERLLALRWNKSQKALTS